MLPFLEEDSLGCSPLVVVWPKRNFRACGISVGNRTQSCKIDVWKCVTAGKHLFKLTNSFDRLPSLFGPTVFTLL